MTAVFTGWTGRLECEHPAVAYLGWLLHGLGARVEDAAGSAQTSDSLALGAAAARSVSPPWRLTLSDCGGQADYRVSFIGIDRPGWEAAGDAAAWGWGGLASITGEPDGPPLAPGAPLASFCSALHAVLALAAARYARLASMAVEIALGDVVASLIEVAGLMHAVDGSVRGRGGDWWGLAGWGVYACSDAKVALAMRDAQQLTRLAEQLEIPELQSERYADFLWGRCRQVEEVHALLVAGFLRWPVAEVVRRLRAERIAIAPVASLPEILASPHLLERRALVQDGGLLLPALPVRGLGAEYPLAGDLVGAATPATRPLAGVRVVDISSVWAAPMAARLLADLGADVVKIERPKKQVGSFSTGAGWDRDLYAILNDRNKRAYVCDFRSPESRAALEEQVRLADVLIENFAAGSLERLALGPEQLHALNPHLILVSMPAMGRTGRDASAVGYGTTIEQAAGIGRLYSDAAGEPHRSGINFSDPIAGLYAAIGAILALCGTREAPTVELSQQEAALSLMAPALAQFQMSGNEPRAVAAERDGDAWSFPLNAQAPATRVPVRDIAGVVGSPEAPGSCAIRWLPHPDGRAYPLVGLPWTGSFSAAAALSPAVMPVPLAATAPLSSDS
jgi:crotonobetainyl-CoA:carnitine CoA-transferase CaiB-like acyl-CoA transferase